MTLTQSMSSRPLVTEMTLTGISGKSTTFRRSTRQVLTHRLSMSQGYSGRHNVPTLTTTLQLVTEVKVIRH